MARKKSAPAAAEPSFEEALAELEGIVAAIEEEQLPLEDLVAKYEQGIQLLTRCDRVLQGAKKRLETIQARHADAPDDESEDEPERPSDPTDPPEDDDIRLL